MMLPISTGDFTAAVDAEIGLTSDVKKRRLTGFYQTVYTLHADHFAVTTIARPV